jgi:hypothetical protein
MKKLLLLAGILAIASVSFVCAADITGKFYTNSIGVKLIRIEQLKGKR